MTTTPLPEMQLLRGWFFFAVLLLMAAAETHFTARPWRAPRGKRWIFHLSLSYLNTVLTRLLFAGPIYLEITLLQNHGWGLSRLLGLKGWAEIAATLVVFDLFNYWWHRWNHRVPFLWRLHKPHHLDTHLDVTTALRFHPAEFSVSYLVKAVWVLIWGPTLEAFLIFEAAITAFSQFHHANIDLPGPVEKIVRCIHMTPRLHAGHHTVTLRTRDANFSTIFIVWDRLFKTFGEPDAEELEKLGLEEGRDTYLQWRDFLKAPLG